VRRALKLVIVDFHYETLARDSRDLKLGHHSVNFDRGGFAADLNVVYPIDRLEELAVEGVIGAVAENHYAFCRESVSNCL
jgi:D-proline reductase (dithiol) PrdB